MPLIRAYCPRPCRIASTAASLTKSGPSKSGNPCARLTAPCSLARRVISVKIVVPNPSSRRARAGRTGRKLSVLSDHVCHPERSEGSALTIDKTEQFLRRYAPQDDKTELKAD